MNRLLVMSPPRADWEWLRRVFPDVTLRRCDPAELCEAVLVVNDHSPEVIALLHDALALREARPGLPLLVLTPVPEHVSALTAMVEGAGSAGPARALPEAQLTAALALERLPVRTRVGTDAISFEYSV